MKKLLVLAAIVLVACFAFGQVPSGQGPTTLNGGITEGWSNLAPGATDGGNLGGPGLGRHDLYDGNGNALGCESCHLPHTAPTYGKAFLWAWKNVPTNITTYKTDANPAGAIGAVTDRFQTSSHSMLCFTCHDTTSANANGITGGVVLQGQPYGLVATSGGSGDIGTQHPVDALVPANLDYQLVQPVTGGPAAYADSASATIGTDLLPLWGTDYRVECTSCHDQHRDYQSNNGTAGGYPFLRVANTNGTYLCRECHNQ